MADIAPDTDLFPGTSRSSPNLKPLLLSSFFYTLHRGGGLALRICSSFPPGRRRGVSALERLRSFLIESCGSLLQAWHGRPVTGGQAGHGLGVRPEKLKRNPSIQWSTSLTCSSSFRRPSIPTEVQTISGTWGREVLAVFARVWRIACGLAQCGRGKQGTAHWCVLRLKYFDTNVDYRIDKQLE